FFFFQAEDGIRDKLVTGVQTCALPIWDPPGGVPHRRLEQRSQSLERVVVLSAGREGTGDPARGPGGPAASPAGRAAPRSVKDHRSEERRVGKECRSRGWAEDGWNRGGE